MFKTVSYELQTVKVGVPVTVLFPYENVFRILLIEASCGCTDFVNDIDKKEIRVTYIPNPVPVHLKESGQHSYYTEKTLTVTFTPESMQSINQVAILSFTAKVIQ